MSSECCTIHGFLQNARSAEVLAEAFPGREILPVAARAIIVGGGNVHCITQQIPEAI